MLIYSHSHYVYIHNDVGLWIMFLTSNLTELLYLFQLTSIEGQSVYKCMNVLSFYNALDIKNETAVYFLCMPNDLLLVYAQCTSSHWFKVMTAGRLLLAFRLPDLLGKAQPGECTEFSLGLTEIY